MLLVTGLLTLLAVAHAEGDHTKGGSHHIKGVASVTQEKVAPEDIVQSAYNFSPKTVVATKGTSGDAAVGKPHSHPGIHHAASVPVAQQQVTIDDPYKEDSTSGIKTFKTSASRKAPFTSQDSQVRDPIPSQEIQTVKTINSPAADSSKGIKTLGSLDVQIRDPIAHPVTKSVKNIKDTFTPDTKSSYPAYTKTVGRNAQASTAGTKSAVRYQVDSQRSSAIPVAVARRRNALETSSMAYTSPYASGGRITSNDGRQNVFLNSGEPQQTGIKIVTEKGEITLSEETFRSLQDMGGIINENGAITLSEEAMQIIQKMGGSISDQTSSVTQLSSNRNLAARGQNSQQRRKPILSSVPKPETTTGSILRTTGLRRQQPVNNQIRRITTDSRTIVSPSNTRSGLGSYQGGSAGSPVFGTSQDGQALRTEGQYNEIQSGGTVLFNGKEISVDGLREGQIFDENLKPILSSNEGTSRTESGTFSSRTSTITGPTAAGGPSSSVISRYGQGDRSTILSGIRPATASQGTRSRVSTRIDSRYATGRIQPVAGAVQPISTFGQGATATRQSEQSFTSSGDNTVLFNGKEISIDQIREGQIFDENLKPILSGVTQDIKPLTRTSTTSGATSGYGQEVGSAVLSGTRPSTTSQGTRSRVATRVDSRYSMGQIKPVAGTAQITPAFRQGQTSTGQSFTSSSGNTVLFNGKEISIDQIREGQIFDENLKPILSGATRGIKPATATRAQSGAFASRNSATQGSRPSVLGGYGQGVRSPVISGIRPAPTSQGTRSRVQSRVDSRYATGQINPVIGTAQTTSAFGQGQTLTGQSLTSSGNTVLFNGKEISIDQIREGQIFDENLKPILSGATQGIKPVTATRAQSGISRTSTTEQSRPSGIGGYGQVVRSTTLSGIRPATTSQVARSRVQNRIDSRLATGQIKPVRGTAQTTSSFAQGQTSTGQSLTSGGNTVLFNGKEISIDHIHEGQIFDENLKPISSGAAQGIKPVIGTRAQSGAFASRTSITQGSRPQVLGRYGQGVTSTALTGTRPATPSQGTRSRVQTRVDSRYATRQIQPARGTTQTTSTFGQGATTIGQSGQSFTSSGGNTVLFNGKEISIDQIREGQIFDENLKPIPSGATEGIKPAIATRAQSGAFASRTSTTQGSRSQVLGGYGQGVTSTSLTGTRPATTSQGTRSRVRTRVDSRYATGQTQPARGTAQTASTFGQVSTTTGQSGQSFISSGGNTVLFDGKEISIDQIREGQMFDENLKPILSGATQDAKPATATRSQSDAFASRTGSRSPVLGGYGQGARSAVLSGTRPSTTSQGTRSRVSTRVDSRYSRGQIQPVTGTSQISRDALSVGTVFFNGKEIRVDGLKPGQIFDENLQPITEDDSGASVYAGNIRSGGSLSSGVPFRGGISTSVGTGLSYQSGTSRISPNALTGFQPSSQGNVPNYSSVYGNRGSDLRGKLNQIQVNQEVSQDEIETKIIQDVHPFALTQENVDIQQEVIQESNKDFIKTVPSASVSAKVPPQLSQKILDSAPSEQTQLRLEDVQEKVPVVLESKVQPKGISRARIRKVTRVSQKKIDDPVTQQQTHNADFSEYLPRPSYLSPFNYKVPQISPLKSGIKTQEQQKVEQVFV